MRRPTTLPTALSTLLALGLLNGCIDDGQPNSDGELETTDAETSGSEETPAPTPEPETTTGTESTDANDDAGETDTNGEDAPNLYEALEGHWVSAVCEPAPQADGSTLYVQRDFTLDHQTWSIIATLFGDEVCSFPLLDIEIAGAYAVVEPAADLEGPHPADFDRSSIALTPHVPDFVDWFNAEGCGQRPWISGQSQDVTEGGCAFVPSAEACPVEHDLVSPSGDDALYFGQRPIDGDMCSAAARPIALGEHPVVRQTR